MPDAEGQYSLPPTRAQPMVTAPSTWPTTLGVLTICLCTLHMLSSVSTALTPLTLSTMRALIPWFPGFGMQTATTWGAWTVVAAIGVVIYAVGFALGIAVHERRGWGARWIRPWAIVTALYVPAITVLTAIMQMENMKAMSSMPGMGANPMMSSVGTTAMSVMSAAINLCWMLAFPAFVIVWFSRPKVAAETARWR